MLDAGANKDDARIRIGDWVFEPALNRLTSGDDIVELEPLAARLLQTLAERPGRVFSNDELVEAVWRGRIVSDNPVYKLMANLRRTLGDKSANPTYIETIRKRGYRLVAPVEPLQSAAGAGGDASGHHPRKPALVAAAIALLAAILFAVAPRESGIDPLAASTAIAVLPFVDMSPSGDQSYLGDGLAEEIIHALTSQAQFAVIGRTSSFVFADDEQDLREVGRQLGARYIVEGSVRQSDDRIRVTAQLIDATDGLHLWSQQFDRTFDDVLAIQSDIAGRVLESVAAEVGAGVVSPRPLTDASAPMQIAAYDAYLRGRQALAQNTAASALLAESEFSRALELQPDMLGAITGIVRSQWLLNYHGQKPAEEAYGIAQPLAERALVIAPDRAETHITLARAAQLNADWPRSEQSMRTAIELEPGNAEALAAYAWMLQMQVRPEEARAVYRKVLKIEPASALLAVSAAMNAEEVGEFGCADRLYRRAVTLKPDLMNAHFGLGSFLWRIHRDFAEAERHLRIATRIDPDGPIPPAFLLLANLDAGNAEVDEWLEEIEPAPVDGYWQSFARLAHAVSSGEQDRAREIATQMASYATDPHALRTLRDWHLGEDRIDDAVRTYPDWLVSEDLVWVTRQNVRSAADLAYALHLAGRAELARGIAEKVLVLTEEMPRLGWRGYHLADVTATLVLADESAAFNRLEQASADGLRTLAWWELDHNVAFQALRVMPEFERLREDFASDPPDSAMLSDDECS